MTVNGTVGINASQNNPIKGTGNSNGHQLFNNQTSVNDSFVSKDQEAVIIGKLANKLDNGSMLSRRSNNFKSLSPVNVDG